MGPTLLTHTTHTPLPHVSPRITTSFSFSSLIWKKKKNSSSSVSPICLKQSYDEASKDQTSSYHSFCRRALSYYNQVLKLYIETCWPELQEPRVRLVVLFWKQSLSLSVNSRVGFLIFSKKKSSFLLSDQMLLPWHWQRHSFSFLVDIAAKVASLPAWNCDYPF